MSSNSTRLPKFYEVAMAAADLNFGDLDSEHGESVNIESWLAALPPSPPRLQFAEDVSVLKAWLNGQPWSDIAIGFDSPARPEPQDMLMARAEISGDPTGSGGFTFPSFTEQSIVDAMENMEWMSQWSANVPDLVPERSAKNPNEEMRALLRGDMNGFARRLDHAEIDRRSDDIIAAIGAINPAFSAKLQSPALARTATAILRQALDDSRAEDAKDLESILFAIANDVPAANPQQEPDAMKAFEEAARILDLAGNVPGQYVPGKEVMRTLEYARALHVFFEMDTDSEAVREPLPRGGTSPDDRLFFQDIVMQALHLSHECAAGPLPSTLVETLLQMRLAQLFRAEIATDEVLTFFDQAFRDNPLAPLQEIPGKCREIFEKHQQQFSPEL